MTKSAACKSVSDEMSSTIRKIWGSEEGAGGGIGVADVDTVDASAASHLREFWTWNVLHTIVNL